jgi:uncharacterized protein YukE
MAVTLHMDVNAVSGVQTKMGSNLADIVLKMKEITSSVNSIRNSTGWVGQSADTFFTQYETLQKDVEGKLTTLTDLAASLKKEITEWTNMQSSLKS